MFAFSFAGMAFAFFYVGWFMWAYDQPNWFMVFVSIFTAAVFAAGIPMANTRYSTHAAIAIITVASLILLVYTAVLSIASDSHLLYLAAGFAMLALVPERLWKTRIGYAAVLVMLVVVCEALFPAPVGLSAQDAARDALAASVNRMWTVIVVAMAMAIMLFRSTRRNRDLSGAAELGEYRANTDPMTGIANRRPVLARLHQYDDDSTGYAIAIIDIDSFKRINDQLGHEEGDALISAIARRLRSHFRQSDLVSRWGGDEFLVLLPNIEQAELFGVLDRLRASVASSPFSLGADPIAITLSIGAAITVPGCSSRRTINAADRALYTAKHTGRNRVVLAGSNVGKLA
ncbi:diguanylate cyclase [Demequina aurantiaca]|uniref:GGDEF domain-containing protein n=1 Tax=Demequina aurantiaca TaxID=676200 RepID=UPI003D3534E5